MDRPLISIIIPAYNSESVISRTIESVLAQTYDNWELIIVDDGSTDNTKEVVGQFVKKDKRISYIWQKNSGGAASPKNTGFKYAKGDFIAYLDHDDEWLSQKLEKQIELFKSNDKLGVVSCNVFVINEIEKTSGERKLSRFKSVKDLLASAGNYVFSNSSAVIPKKVIEKVGPRDENLKLFEDQDMFIRIAEAGYDIDSPPEILLKYYISKKSLSQNFEKAAQDYERFINKHRNLLEKYPKVFSSHLRHLGTTCMLSGNGKKARNIFLESIKIFPSLKGLLVLFFSIFGSKIFTLILNFKKWYQS